MPSFSVLQCGARKNQNQPQLTLHRFPKNEGLRIKWLRAIGKENINPRHKKWYLCSLHFEQSCFNRTLDVIRIHDNSVPTILPASSQKSSVLCETGNITDVASISAVAPLPIPCKAVNLAQKQVILEEKIKVLKEKCVDQKKKLKCLNEKLRRKSKKIANLKDIIEDLKQKAQINMEQAVLIEDLAGPQEFLKRQMINTKGLPMPKK